MYSHVPTFEKKTGLLNAIVDTPKGSPNKYKFDESLGLYRLGGVLPLGHAFPFDFGFIPGTLGGDGDPLDVLILIDYPAFVGCVVASRLIGGITAVQTERDKKQNRNDRLVAVADKSIVFGDVREMDDLPQKMIYHIEHFFISYNEAKGKKFEIESRIDSKAAMQIVLENAV